MSESPPRPPRINIGGRHLVREPEDRMVGGVCSGVADALGVDVTLVRVLTVVLAIVTPWTLVAYLIALFVLPERRPDEPRERSEAAGPLAHAPVPVLVAAVVVGVLVLGDAWWLHPVPAALVLVGIGVWLVTRGRVPETQHFVAEGAHSTTIPTDVVEPPLSGVTAEYDGTGWPDEPSPPGSNWSPGAPSPDATIEDATAPDWYTAPMATTAKPAPPPPAPAFAPIVTAILLVGGGTLWLLDSLGAVDVGWRGAAAVGLVLVGVTLVVATWWGRAAGLIPLAVILATLLVLDDAVAVPIDAGIGDRTVVVTTSEEVEDHQQLLMGDLTVDLTKVPSQSGSTQDVEVSVGIGQMRVLVPRDATVTADAKVRAGDLDWPGEPDVSHESGVDVDRSFSVAPLGGTTGGPHLHLDLSMGLGNVEVVRG